MKNAILAFLFSILAFFCNAQKTPCELAYEEAEHLYLTKQHALLWNNFNKYLQTCADTSLNKNTYWLTTYLWFFKTAVAVSLGYNDSAIFYGEKVAATFEVNKRTNREFYYFNMLFLGDAYRMVGKSKAAAQCYRIGTDTLFKYGFDKTSQKVYFKYSILYGEMLDEAYGTQAALTENLWLKNQILRYVGYENEYMSILLGNIGTNYQHLNNYDSALHYSFQALEMKKKILGANDNQVALTATNIGYVYQEMGNYPKALEFYTLAKNIYETNNLSNKEGYAVLLNNLGNCYVILERYNEAATTLIKALTIAKELYGPYHSRVALIYNNVGDCFNSAGEYRDAINMYKYAELIYTRLKLDSTENMGTVYSNLGKGYSNFNKLDSSLYYLNKAEGLYVKKFGKNFIRLLNCYNNFGAVYVDKKDFAKANYYFTKALEIGNLNYGNFFVQKFDIINNVALTHLFLQQYAAADSLVQQSFLILKDFVLNNTEGLTEEEKYAFATNAFQLAWMGIDIRNKAQSSNLDNSWLANCVLLYKGLTLESKRGLLNKINNLKDTALINTAYQFLAYKKLLGNELLKPITARSKEVNTLQQKIDVLERKLTAGSATFRDWKKKFTINWQQVKESLAPNEVAVEFVAYNNMQKEKQYAALVIDKKTTNPVLVNLFAEKDFNKLLGKGSSQERAVKKIYRSTIGAKKEQQSDSLYYLLWKPLENYLVGKEKIYFSADGIINNINLAALMQPNGNRLCQQYQLIQLSSTRNITLPKNNISFNKIGIWGGINYNDANNNTPGDFAYLEGTLQEAQALQQLFLSNKKQTSITTGNNATEIHFKANAGKYNIVHIATHGFFLSNHQKLQNQFAQSKEPLLKSGLAFKGANVAWSGKTINADDDGILTAYEITTTALDSTQMVVLSACETGLGEITSGEGVYGLQRAFKMAGVNYLIMSLWQVPDLETKEFMETFYKYALQGKTIHDAFRATQIDMNKKYQPYQWAAFVLVD